MALKTVDIEWEGSPAKVKFESTLKFGEVEGVLARSVKISLANESIDVDFYNYRLSVMLAVIKEAPFKVTVDGIQNLPDDIAEKIADEIFKVYPLERFLTRWLKTIKGSVETQNKES